MPNELKPCPFCGSKNISKEYADWGHYRAICGTAAQGRNNMSVRIDKVFEIEIPKYCNECMFLYPDEDGDMYCVMAESHILRHHKPNEERLKHCPLKEVK